MEGILDAIFSNIFIIMALLAGLFGFFKNEDDKKDHDERPTRDNPTSKQETSEKQTIKERFETFKQEVETTISDVQSDSSNEWYQALEDSQKRREESLEDTAERMVTSDKIKAGSIVPSDHRSTTRISVKENLNKKRLVESLIMSEVLDQPKSTRRKRQA
ncbi:hypothetical protein ACFFJI_02495 [Allobacillus sp. GCM10007491]|uniref:Uncharacterized protein n=1 Tax=Allobacillus saliphilus TaxID=2912308 RepID=A0A941CV86_9BACI|nr:hypothetical protein [Allobacillus saliphilus]MBR7553325.1 hypothetical protein [Allobacillus saliphilus]